jgi:uncharacterized protein (TIGR02453 family)
MTRMCPTSPPRFSENTFKFIQKASRQKKPDWLDKNRDEYEIALLKPLQNLSSHLKTELSSVATQYHFPLKGIGRIKRSINRVGKDGTLYKDWISYAASRPAQSRFDHNPNLFFMIHPDDEAGDRVLVAGGLYMPSSRQLRAVREAIAEDAAPFDRLFDSKDFTACFKGGFSDERISSRSPRGFNPTHPRMNWLRLQAFFVWKPYKDREFFSRNFPEQVARDWKQILRLNSLLDQAVQGQLKKPPLKVEKSQLLSHLADLDLVGRKLDF